MPAGMALHTTITFLIAGASACKCHAAIPSWRCSGKLGGSQMARRVLWGAIGLPVALGLVCVQSDKLALSGGQVSVTIFAVLMGLLLILLLARGPAA